MTEKNYKLVIFDFDGTLADTFPWFLKAMDDVSEKFRIRRVQESDIESMRALETKQLLKFLKIRWWTVPKLSTYMRAKMKEDAHTIKLFEGTPDTIHGLIKSGVRIAIVSSNSLENVKLILGPELTKKIAYFSCGSSLFGKKKKFIEIMNKAGFTPSETICIGDETRDVEAAKKVGAKAGAVTWGYATREALSSKNPDYLFDQFRDILFRSPDVS